MIACSTGLLFSIIFESAALLNGGWSMGQDVPTLFFAAIAGPWVGLFIGGVSFYALAIEQDISIGNSFGEVIRDSFDQAHLALALVFGLLGFILGLTYRKTHGQFTHFRPIAYVELIACIELGIPGLIIALINLPLSSGLINFFSFSFSIIFFPLLVLLIFLLIALSICGRFQMRGMKSSL
jgi:hypothetical protein